MCWEKVAEKVVEVAKETIQETEKKVAEVGKEIGENTKSIFPDFFKDLPSEAKSDTFSDSCPRKQWNVSSEISDMSKRGMEPEKNDNPESDLEKTLEDYFSDLKEKSEYPETILDKPFDVSDLEKRSPEENAEKRDEFDDKKEQLKREWEETNGMPWPKYDHDVYSSNDKLIRKAGSDYDAHHIQPLGMGGENKASNITPLNAEVHYDKQGVHALDSPYSKLDRILGGM